MYCTLLASYKVTGILAYQESRVVAEEPSMATSKGHCVAKGLVTIGLLIVSCLHIVDGRQKRNLLKSEPEAGTESYDWSANMFHTKAILAEVTL